MTKESGAPNVNRHVSKGLRAIVKRAVAAGWRLEFAAGHAQRCQLVAPDGTVFPLAGSGSHSGGPGEVQLQRKLQRALASNRRNELPRL